MVALLAEGVDRNGLLVDCLVKPEQSPSSRRAWIEIASLDDLTHVDCVALLAEGVDRNILMLILLWITCVALLAEGVDRNS